MAEGDANKNGEAPVFTVLTQYLKDFSFESPNAPQALRPRDKAPEINIGINVNANPMEDGNYDVVLSLTAKAGEGKDMLFNVELVYGVQRRIGLWRCFSCKKHSSGTCYAAGFH